MTTPSPAPAGLFLCAWKEWPRASLVELRAEAYFRPSIWKVPVPSAREPIFNVPFVVLAMAALMALIHAWLSFVLTEDQTNNVLVMFAFIPARYDASVLASEPWTTGWGAAVWTFFTYAFFHSDLTHLAFNLVWLLAFGTAIARRFGAPRFTGFFLLTAAAGAAAHLAAHFGEPVPMIGASAGITGFMAGVMRFMFQPGGRLNVLAARDGELAQAPAMPLAVMLRNPRVVLVLGVSVGVFVLFGLRVFALPGVEQGIAWEAHVGGFVAGLIAFAWFDPVGPAPAALAMESPDPEPSREPTQDHSAK
jgi:membrane associated rhomboid family serine protease